MREEDEEQLSRPEEENIKPTDYKNVPEMDIPPLPIPDILVFFSLSQFYPSPFLVFSS